MSRTISLLSVASLVACGSQQASDDTGTGVAASMSPEITFMVDRWDEELHFAGAVRTDEGVRFFGDITPPDHDEPLVQIASAQFAPSCAVDRVGAVLCFEEEAQVELTSLGTPEDPAMAVDIEYQNACALTPSGDLRCIHYTADLLADPLLGLEDKAEIGTWSPPSPAVELNVGVNQVVLRLANDELWSVRLGGEGLEPVTQAKIVRDVRVWDGADPNPLYLTETGERPWDLPEQIEDASALTRVGCAVIPDGEVRCWEGSDGAPQTLSLPAPAIDISGLYFYPPDVNERPVCALLDDESVWCWGNDLVAIGVD